MHGFAQPVQDRKFAHGTKSLIVRRHLLAPPALRVGGPCLSIARPFPLVARVRRVEMLALKLAGRSGNRAIPDLDDTGEPARKRLEKRPARVGPQRMTGGHHNFKLGVCQRQQCGREVRRHARRLDPARRHRRGRGIYSRAG
jgi:hypothetical protein